MLNICICDDEPRITDQLEGFIRQLEQEDSREELHFSSTIYHSGKELLENYKNQFDVILLDVEIGNDNGINVAKALREKNCDAILIFITQYLQYATEGYKVKAYRYILKPVDYQSFATEVKAAAIEAEKREKSIAVMVGKDQYANVKMNDIISVEIFGRNAIIHLKSRDINTYETLKNIGEKLDDNVFVKVYKNCIVNLDKVTRYTATTIYMSNQSAVPLSRHRATEFRQKYVMYWGSRI